MCIKRYGKPYLFFIGEIVESKERTAKWRRKKISNGLCPSCGREKTNGKRCRDCLKLAKENQQEKRKERFKNGLCVTCGRNKYKENKQRCQDCCDKHKKWYNEYNCVKNNNIIEGMCCKCGINTTMDNKKTCETCLGKHKEWWKKSGYRERQRLLAIQKRKERKIRVINKYGGKCICCEESEIVFLCLDHKNGGGNEHRRQMNKQKGRCGSSSTQFYKWVEKNNYPDILQVLCYNCNAAKEISDDRICPHQKIKNIENLVGCLI